MGDDLAPVVESIAAIAPMLHTAGPMAPQVLRAIYRRIQDRRIDLSVETGSGASTLLLSHCSRKHLVFAHEDDSGSISNVRKSPLLNSASVQFVEGPTQKTLPEFTFPGPIQFALIDGPHAYPFPDLEYYYIYPQLSAGALLVLDDIHIRTIHHLFRFLKEDAMFSLDEVVGTTAFFTRTEAPVFCPAGDGWQFQRYNQRVLRRYDWPRQMREWLPVPVRRVLKDAARRFQGHCRIWIDHPRAGSAVGRTGRVTGKARGDLRDRFLWVMIRREDQDAWWPQGDGPVTVNNGAWECAVEYGGPDREDNWFEIAAVLTSSPVNSYFLKRPAPVHDFPFRKASVADAYTRVRRQ